MGFPEHITIASHTIQVVPRYVETDQAGVIHHSVYAVWLEMGRTELLRANGLAYKDLEAAGYLFVVAELHIKFRRPARYDQTLSLRTTCTKVTASRVEHTYELTEPVTGVVLTEASTTLACVDHQGRLQRMPEFMYPNEEKKEARSKM
jgi:acyl-CoA thioester hydrolase